MFIFNKKSLKKTLILIISGLFLSVFLVSYLLGLHYDPDFSKMDCSSITVAYWIKIDNTKKLKKQHLEINNRDTITLLKKKFNILEIKGEAVPFYCDTKITLSDGRTWGVNAIFKNSFMFWSYDNKYGLYTVVLKSNDFYDYLLSLCLENERKSCINAKLNNITLCPGYCVSSLEPIECTK